MIIMPLPYETITLSSASVELLDLLITLRQRKNWENTKSEKPHCWNKLTSFLKIHAEITAANNYIAEIGATDSNEDIPFRQS